MLTEAEKEKRLLKIVACGSVDDGKSTLIGHMLYDAKLIFADQAQALELESKAGSADGDLDYSLLLDGLLAEREQGITIDVAYRYFSTDKRSFIVADAPGHEEYTRNMAVGASFADVAVILVDATKGLLKQTLRHTRICKLMGIRHFVFAVNKMDLVGFDERRFDDLRREVTRLAAEVNAKTLAVIPVSAKQGDNITSPSRHMAWFDGPALLAYLEEGEFPPDEAEAGFTLPVQRASRPNSAFRGFQGTIASGRVHVGDAVEVQPSKTTSKIASISVAGEAKDEAGIGQAVTVTLEDEVDVSRGCVIASAAQTQAGTFLSATVLWMDDDDLVAGKNYLFKLGTKSTPGIVLRVKHLVDVHTGERVPATRARKNEIAECEVSFSEPVVHSRFVDNRTLGSMILIDRVTNNTAGCGVIEGKLERDDNLTWHDMDITRSKREEHMGQRALTLWLTGLSGSGKSTLANEVEKRLCALGRFTMLLDGDNIRLGLNGNLGFSEEDRIENIRRIAEVSKLMNDAGLIVITSFISPFVRDRRRAAEIIGAGSFIEVHVATPLEVCEQRDVKGLYAKARRGEISNFTGISSPYEAPERPDVVVDTAAQTIDEAASAILGAVARRLEEMG